MDSNRAIVLLAALAGVALVIVGIVYCVDTADALPSFFPGHEAGSTDHHIKHGLLAFFLALCCFAFVWFRTGPSATSAS